MYISSWAEARWLKAFLQMLDSVELSGVFLLLAASDCTTLWHLQIHLTLMNTLFLDQSASDVCLCVIEDAAENQGGFAWSHVGLFSW